MLTRSLVGLVAVCLLVGCGTGGGQYATADQLLARSDGKLQYPGAQLLNRIKQDELHPGNEAPTAASVTTTLASADSQEMVIAWYGQQLQGLGYTTVTPRPGETATWRHGNYWFFVTYGAAIIWRGTPPPGKTLFVTVFSVAPSP